MVYTVNIPVDHTDCRATQSVKKAGLPEGCENLSSTGAPKMTLKLFHGIDLLQPQVKTILHCLWLSLSIELGIPRLAFSGSGFFNLGVANSIDYCQPHGNVASETESSVPDNEVFSSLFDELKKAERKSFGVYMKSFYEFFHYYYYREARTRDFLRGGGPYC